MIDWKVRIHNKIFWTTLIPALLLLIKQILALFGVQFDSSVIETQIVEIISTVFVVLTLLGVVTDPTTPGINDRR